MKNTLENIFELAIKTWMQNDVRSLEQINEYLEEIKANYEKLDENKKQYFDTDHLTNPYTDSKIYHKWNVGNIKKVVIWIDIEGQELLTINEYNKLNPNQKIDAVIWHHPEWKALLDIAEMMKTIQTSVEYDLWIAINQTEKINEPRIGKVTRSIYPHNLYRTINIAKMLDIPFCGFHTPADNCCYSFLKDLFKKNENKISKLKDIIEILEEIPEMNISKKLWIWPTIFAWSPDSKAWKIAIAWITGWTSGSKDIYPQYVNAWIGTILAMHMSEDHLEEAKKNNLNVVITDHIASDSLWMNLIADEYEKLWIEIIELGWFIRVSRVK